MNIGLVAHALNFFARVLRACAIMVGLGLCDVELQLLPNGSDRLLHGRHGHGNPRWRLRFSLRYSIPKQRSGHTRLCRQDIRSARPEGPAVRGRILTEPDVPPPDPLFEMTLRFNLIKETYDENHTCCCGSIARLWRRRLAASDCCGDLMACCAAMFECCF